MNGGELAREYGGHPRTWRKRIKARDRKQNVPVVPDTPHAFFAETHEILGDGRQTSTKLLDMDDEQQKSPRYLLVAHGFDPEAWELVAARNNVWNVYSAIHHVQTLYSSKITVRPISGGLTVDALVSAVRGVAPVTVDAPRQGAGLLEVNCSDMHLGNSSFEWYADNLARIVERIQSRNWLQIVLPIGSDLFHCDNFKNTTSNGTLQSSMSWPEAWADAARFYATVIEAALAHSEAVYCYYIIGNHDESMSWAFCNYLAARYPQVTFDLGIDERKVHSFGDVAVGMTHGDGRTRRDLDRIFLAEFPAFATARVREVHAGHYHHEMTRDEYGTVVRSLSTAARTDKWHREEGYVGACKRFACFEYDTDALNAVHYV